MHGEEYDVEGRESSGDEEDPASKRSTPVTPRMLIKALKLLKRSSFRELFFSPREVTTVLWREFPGVEKDFYLLFMEVSDKLACAAAAGLIGSKPDLGYCVQNMREQGMGEYSRSELMFWIFYKRLLNEKAESKLQEKKEKENKAKETEETKQNASGFRSDNIRHHPYSPRRRH